MIDDTLSIEPPPSHDPPTHNVNLQSLLNDPMYVEILEEIQNFPVK